MSPRVNTSIKDEIHFPPPKAPEYNVVGGAGSFAALGARLFCPPPKSRAVGWIVDAGSDFPGEIGELIEAWETSCLLRKTPGRLTTRGWNEYGENDYRAFRYTTPKSRLDHGSLTPPLLLSKSFHLICSPARCIDLIQEILEKRKQLRNREVTPSPIFVWEPVPDLCKPENLDECYAAMKLVDVVSPNHDELRRFFSEEPVESDFDGTLKYVEEYSRLWLSAGIGQQGKGAIVVRAGAHGCFVANRDISRWISAYYGSTTAKVVDPTGGGNAFLGGLAIGLVNGRQENGVDSIVEAANWGSIAASFAIEQVGLPKLTQGKGGERWNGECVLERLSAFEQNNSNI